MKGIVANLTENDVVVILTGLLKKDGYFDSKDLIDSLESVKSPLVIHNKNGDRKLKPSINRKLKQTFNMVFDRSDNCWYKR